MIDDICREQALEYLKRCCPKPVHRELTPIIPDRGLRDLSRNDAELRFWLPEEGKFALDAIVTRLDVVRAKYLRDFFVISLYGMHELLRMQKDRTGLYYVPPPPPHPPPRLPDGLLYSRAHNEECIPGLGKNIVPIKLFLPCRLKDDLHVLADRIAIPLSQFVREMLISHFFGQTFWPDRMRKWTAEQERIATEWEQGLRKAVSRSIDSDEVMNRKDESGLVEEL